jgi:hypothetical protein
MEIMIVGVVLVLCWRCRLNVGCLVVNERPKMSLPTMLLTTKL